MVTLAIKRASSQRMVDMAKAKAKQAEQSVALPEGWSVADFQALLANLPKEPSQAPVARPQVTKTVKASTTPTADSKNAPLYLDALLDTVEPSISTKAGVPFISLPVKFGTPQSLLDATAIILQASTWAQHILDNIDKFSVSSTTKEFDGERVKIDASDVRAYCKGKLRAYLSEGKLGK